jgi:digeranylgeranylglycerophospholipid reductase
MEKVDIVIVGGGIAGLAVAKTICSDSNLDVVLVEKNSIGANQTTPVVFPDTICEYGLEDSILQYYTGFVYHSPLRAMAKFDYKRNALASLNYQKACMTLYEQASSNGLELYKGKAVNWSPRIPDPAQPLLIHLDNGEKIQTQVLIDASGYTQWAAEQLQIRLSPYYSVCYGEFLTECSFKDSSTFYFLAPNSHYGNGGGWFYPISKKSASLGYAMLTQKPFQPEKTLVEGYLKAKQAFQPYADWVKEGTCQQKERGIIPVGRISRFVDNRVIITGDAAGQANPWCMMGINTGLLNGRLCAKVVLEAFSKKRFDRSILSSYERQWYESNNKAFRVVTNIVIPDFLQRSDEDWDQFTSLYNGLSPEQQLWYLRDYPSSIFYRAYAVAGYIRRRLVKWIRE